MLQIIGSDSVAESVRKFEPLLFFFLQRMKTAAGEKVVLNQKGDVEFVDLKILFGQVHFFRGSLDEDIGDKEELR